MYSSLIWNDQFFRDGWDMWHAWEEDKCVHGLRVKPWR